MVLGEIHLIKYHALGNDYLFLDSATFDKPSSEFIKQICHRNFGIGSDGLLYGGYVNGQFKLTIFNPDSSIAEISGNGTRIFARAMFDLGLINIGQKFEILTNFRTVSCCLMAADCISVNMGSPSFEAPNIPIVGKDGANITINGRTYKYYSVSLGNPHCVIFVDAILHEDVLSDGPILEKNIAFPEKTNVQFAHIIDSENISIEIWERGAGYTLASGSSACAVFSVARKLKICFSRVTVHMPGGDLLLLENSNETITQTGPVVKIADCEVGIKDLPTEKLHQM
ncbi:MAG: diaminopimelate epimerase [Opitutales bacterium]|nr:diaminopimelate epimerase [Opitutales bacterium]